jgi:aconitate hydratase
MTLKNPDDYDKFEQGAKLSIKGFAGAVATATEAELVNETTGESATVCLNLTERQRKILLAGGLLNYTKMNG